MKHNTKRALLTLSGVLLSAKNALAAGDLATGNLTAANTGDIVNNLGRYMGYCLPGCPVTNCNYSAVME